MAGTMGDSTRARIGSAIRTANGGGAGGGDRAPGAYVGSYGGGLGGTWAKAPTQRGGDPMREGTPGVAGSPARPPSASRMRPPPGTGSPGSPGPGGAGAGGLSPPMGASHMGQRERIRPASNGAKNAWDELPKKDLPRAPAFGATTKQIKPPSATLGGGKTTRPLTGIGMDLKAQGFGQMEVVGGCRGAIGGGGGGGVGGAAFGSPDGPPPARVSGGLRRGPLSYNTGPMPMGRAAAMIADQQLQQEEGEGGGVAAAEQQMASMQLSGDIGGGGAGPGPDLTDGAMSLLEDQIRDALRARRSVYEDSKSMLLRMFKSVDDGSGDVSWDEFSAICGQLGVTCSRPEAQRLFERFGYRDRLPYTRFASILLTQPSRQLAEDMPTRHGPFKDVAAAQFHGKIKDKRCRKTIYTPGNWDPQIDAARSAELPDKRLVLSFVYGYNGKDATSQNLFYNCLGQAVYFVAGLGVVYTRPAGSAASSSPEAATEGSPGSGHSQHFFLGHTDDVKALALCPAEVDVAGKKYPPRSIAATAQASSHEEGPYICVWDTRVGSQQGESQLARLAFKKEDRGFSALGFSPDGVFLAAVANDNAHTVYVYDWRRNRQEGSGRGQMGDPPQVYGLEWNPHAGRYPAVPHAFVTFGKKNIKMWTREGPGGGVGGTWVAKALSTGRMDLQNVHSAAWLAPRQEGGSECLVVAGMADGQLYIFKGTTAIKSIAAHARGPQSIQPDGHVAYTGVRGMRLVTEGGPDGKQMLLTGGADSTILRWDVSDGSLAEGRFVGPPLSLRSPMPDRGHCIRSLDWDPSRGMVLVGTNQCGVMEVSDMVQDVLVYGHSDDVWAVAFHPTRPATAATASEKAVYQWDLAARRLDRSAVLGFAARAVAYSCRPLERDGATHHLAVGGSKGDIMVVLESTLQPVHRTKDSREGVTDLKYSPDGRLLAAATADTWIDIYNAAKGYQRLSRCSGHSSTVRGIDWSSDSSILQSDSADLELLVWNARTGKQIPIPSRDVSYASYTVRLGFPVMGIWPDGSDGTDVNAVDRSHGGDVVATCDDDGLVKLFACPCVLDDAPHRAYRGHSSHVLGVRFSCDDNWLLSVGGYDWAMFQFGVVQLAAPPSQPEAPQKVWGALDPEGRSYGWTYAPYDVRRPGAAAAAAGGSPPPRPPPHPGTAAAAPSPPPPSVPLEAAAPGQAAAGLPGAGGESPLRGPVSGDMAEEAEEEDFEAREETAARPGYEASGLGGDDF